MDNLPRAASSGRVLFRMDAGPQSGIGPAMRCFALAEALRAKDKTPIFASAQLPDAVRERFAALGSLETIAAEPGSIEDAEATAQLAVAKNADWLVVDGAACDETYQAVIRSKSGRGIMLIHDGQLQIRYPCDIIINPSIDANPSVYGVVKGVPKLGLGLRYMPLRREFSELFMRQLEPRQGCHVLITCGGADPDDMTRRLVNALEAARLTDSAGLPLVVTVVIGPANPRAALLQEQAKAIPGMQVLVDVQNMAELLAGHDIVVAAGGSTLWEAMAAGAVVVGVAREAHQEAMMNTIVAAGFSPGRFTTRDFDQPGFLALLERLVRDPEWRQEFSIRGSQMLDGRGAARCLELMGY